MTSEHIDSGLNYATTQREVIHQVIESAAMEVDPNSNPRTINSLINKISKPVANLIAQAYEAGVEERKEGEK